MDTKTVITRLHADTDCNVPRLCQLYQECQHFILCSWEWYVAIELAQVYHVPISTAHFGFQPAGQHVLQRAVQLSDCALAKRLGQEVRLPEANFVAAPCGVAMVEWERMGLERPCCPLGEPLQYLA